MYSLLYVQAVEHVFKRDQEKHMEHIKVVTERLVAAHALEENSLEKAFAEFCCLNFVHLHSLTITISNVQPQ